MASIRDFLPSRESDLVTWTGIFKMRILASPLAYGISLQQAENYAVLSDAFVAAYELANAGLTRSPVNITIKNSAMQAMVASARLLSRMVQSTPGVTTAQKVELGLTARTTMPTRLPVPEAVPVIQIIAVNGRIVKVRLRDSQSSSHRGRPADVGSACIYSYVGEEPPTDARAYRFERLTMQTVVDLVFPDTVPGGATVWLGACWLNPRGERGASCAPVSVTIQGGPARAAA